MSILSEHVPTEEAPHCEGARRGFFRSPWFYLIYLVFYFSPWFFEPLRVIDVVAACVAIGVFLPIYFRAFEGTTWRTIPLILAIEAIGFCVSPFAGMYGSFHVYAMAQSGFQRPPRNAIILLACLTTLYTVVSVWLGTHWIEITFVACMGAVIGAGCIASAEQIEYGRLMERSRQLDRRMAAVAERERIARDLHDVLGHTLNMVTLKADVAVRLVDQDPARARREMEEIRDAGRQALKDVRETVAGMASTTLDVELAAARSALDSAGIVLTTRGIPPQIDGHMSKTLGFCLREAVTNIIRHAGARHAIIDFAGGEDELAITIEDDGSGTVLAEGSGLNGIRQRLQAIGGRLDTGLSAAGGVRLVLTVPEGSAA